MQLRSPFYELAGQFAVDLPGSRAVFSTRRGGCSRGPYESLNLGWLTDDDPNAVARNRAALAAMVGAPPMRFVRQVHGAEVVRVGTGRMAADAVTAASGASVPGASVPGAAGAAGPATAIVGEGNPPPRPRADGQATATRGIALAALTADCLPIAIAGDGAVAMVHAGWRGLAAGVVEAGVRAVRDLGASGELRAAIGPGAGPCCYEAGAEVHEAFADIPQAHRGAIVDLKLIARARLRDAGVGETHDIGICTICSDPALLFSHRRDGGVTGRQAGVAWLI